MRLIRLALIGTTALFLAVNTHATAGDACNNDDECIPAACCDAITGECGSGPADSVSTGNSATQGCECAPDEPFMNPSACGACATSSDCDGDLCCEPTLSLRCSTFDMGSLPDGTHTSFPCECAPDSPYDGASETCVGQVKKDCSSTVCDDGYTLIENASTVECDDNVCGNSQCCDLACSSYHCPTRYSLVIDADSKACSNGRCNRRQCCDRKDAVCSSYHCPKHYSPVHNAETKVCNRRGCNTRQCCDKDDDVCSSYRCPRRYSLVRNAHNKVCHHHGCDKDQCCKKNGPRF